MMLCCRKHWYQLPPALRSKIRLTAGLPSIDPKRRKLLEEAFAVWKS